VLLERVPAYVLNSDVSSICHTWKIRVIADLVAMPNLPTSSEDQGNVILSAAASPIQTRTSAGRRPKDLESALGRSRPERTHGDPRITLLTGHVWCCRGYRSFGRRQTVWQTRLTSSGDAQDDILGGQPTCN
jgi:hypothetical protein